MATGEKDKDVRCSNTFMLLSCFLFLLPHNCWGGHQRASALFKILRYNCIKAKISSGNQKHSILYNAAMLAYFVTKNMTQHTFKYIFIYISHVYVFLKYTHICLHYLHIYSMFIIYMYIIFFTEIQNFVSMRICVFNHNYLQKNGRKFGNVATYRFKWIQPNTK